MAINTSVKTASEIIDEFFDSLPKVQGIDGKTASIIQKLWKDGKLSRDELLAALSEARKQEG